VRDATFTPSEAHERVTLELDGQARWVAEQFPVEETTELPDGGFRVVLRVASPAWLQHLLLRLAPQLRSAEPATVVVGAAAAAQRALDAYQGLERDAGYEGPPV